MPQELLRDVVGHRDQTCAARQRWYVLPLSIAAHGAIGVAILIVPLAAEFQLPSPPPLSRFVHVVSVTPIPRAPDRIPVSGAPNLPSARSVFAPTRAPAGIAPEPAGPVVPGALPGPVVESGFGTGPMLPGPTVSPVEPPPPPVRYAPVRVGGSIRRPTRIAGAVPIYPLAAQQARLEGTVVLDLTIDVHGNVEDLRVVTSAALFDQAAVDAVRSWRFTPTLLNGVPVPVLMTVTVKFTLQR